MIRVTANLNNPKLTKVIDGLEKNLSRAVRLTTFELEREAKRNAPVDTGALRASIFSVVDGKDGSAKALSAATKPRRSRYTAGAKVAEVSGRFRRPNGPYQGAVAVGVKYGRPVNYIHKPFLTAAAWRARRKLRERAKMAMRGEVPK